MGGGNPVIYGRMILKERAVSAELAMEVNNSGNKGVRKL